MARLRADIAGQPGTSVPEAIRITNGNRKEGTKPRELGDRAAKRIRRRPEKAGRCCRRAADQAATGWERSAFQVGLIALIHLGNRGNAEFGEACSHGRGYALDGRFRGLKC